MKKNIRSSLRGIIYEYTAQGWTNRLVTGKSVTVSVSGKRNVGDPGNDYIEGIALKIGKECNTTLVSA